MKTRTKKTLERAHEGLLAAVFLQAINDRQNGTKRQRHDAITFLRSEGISWLWGYVTDGVSGMPDVAAATCKALSDPIDLRPKTHRRTHRFEREVPA